MTLVLFISVICVAFSIEDSNDYDISRREVLLRRIGHELLLQWGDSISRVLPVKKITENEYQIRFEKDLTFQPDSLVDLIRRLLAKDPLASDYVVNILNCGNASVVYGYAISKNKKDDIVACLGRRQPRACYMINIMFKPTGMGTAKNGYILASLPLVAFVGFIFLRSVKSKRALPEVPGAGTFNLGSVFFDSESRELIINGKTIDLTKFGTALYDWQKIRVSVVGKSVGIFLNDGLIFETEYNQSIGPIKDISYFFKGVGQIDDVVLKDAYGNAKFSDDFESNSTPD